MKDDTAFFKLLVTNLLKINETDFSDSIGNEGNVANENKDCINNSLLEDFLELHGQILIHEIAIKELQKVAKDRMEAAFFDTASDYMDEFLIKCFRHDLSNYELAMLTRLNLQQYRF